MNTLQDVRSVPGGVLSSPRGVVAADADIRESVTMAIRWNTGIPRDAFTVVVEQGLVTLVGDVPRDYQRKAAAIQAARTPGVRAVTNLLTAQVLV